MDIAELLKATPQDLANRQENELRLYVVNKLKKFVELVANKHYKDAYKLLESSPSGDEAGSDNMYIDFSELKLDTENGTDIGTVLEKLMALQKINDK
jgi:hypothetical protein